MFFEFIILFFIVYFYCAISLQVIAKRTNTNNSWLAWIPFANLFLMCKIARVALWWFILLFIPLINIFIFVVLWMKISQQCGFSKYVGLVILVPIVNLFIFGFLAFWGKGKVNKKIALVISCLFIVCVIGVGLFLTKVKTIMVEYDTKKQELFSKTLILEYSAFERIEIYNIYGKDLIIALDDVESFKRAANAFLDIEKYLPSHPSYQYKFYVKNIMLNGDILEYELCVPEGKQGNVDLYFVNKVGNTTKYYGSARSKTLYKWLVENNIL